MKKLVILITFLMTWIASAQWYYGSGEVVNLENIIGYDKQGQKIIAGVTTDPTTTSKSGDAGSLLLRTDGSAYLKQDAGNTTNWDQILTLADSSLFDLVGTATAIIAAHTATYTHADIALNTAKRHDAVTLGVPANGLYLNAQQVSMVSASHTSTGSLTSDDYTTFTDKVSADFGSNIVYPKPIEYSGTNRTVSDETTLNAAMAASSDGDVITLTSSITLSSTLVINKAVKITGPYALESAGSAVDPVVLVSVTVDSVYFDRSVIVRHRKTTNTSVETAVSVNASNFVSYAQVEFMEFGYSLRGSFTIGGKTTYTGALANNHGHISIYKVSSPSQVNGVVYDFPSEATPRSSFVYQSYNAVGDNFDYNLRIANTTQLDMTKVQRQFYLTDSQTKSGNGNPSLIFDNNVFNHLNGGIGLTGGSGLGVLDFYSFIALINNYEGNAAVAGNQFKGMMYLTGSGALHDIGRTTVYYAGNIHPYTLRSANDYTSLYDYAGIGYNNTVYSTTATFTASSTIPNNNIAYNYTRGLPTQAQMDNLTATASTVGKLLTGYSKTGSLPLSATDSIISAIGKLENNIGTGGVYRFQDLTDVSLTSTTTGDYPRFNSVSGKWENTAFPSLNFDPVGTATAIMSAHTSLYDHTAIAHTNRAALDAVTGTNTGDETYSSIVSKLGFTPLSDSASITHNLTSGLDGGISGQYYHLSLDQFNAATRASSTSTSGLATLTDSYSASSSSLSLTQKGGYDLYNSVSQVGTSTLLTGLDTTGTSTSALTASDTIKSGFEKLNSLPKTMYLKDVKSAGTSGGTFTSGAWQLRTFNTVSGDTTIATADTGTSSITLSASGKYYITVFAPAFSVAAHIAKLRNVTDQTDDLIGSSGYSGAGSIANTYSIISGSVTIITPKTFSILHKCYATESSDGFGFGYNIGADQVYTQIVITKYK